MEVFGVADGCAADSMASPGEIEWLKSARRIVERLPPRPRVYIFRGEFPERIKCKLERRLSCEMEVRRGIEFLLRGGRILHANVPAIDSADDTVISRN